MSRRRLFALSLPLLAAACAPPGGDDPLVEAMAIDVHQDAIKDGQADATTKGVVGITITAAGTLCTGSLIAPNVVLTARHCVSPTEPDGQSVVCSETTNGVPYSAKSFFVTTADEITPGTALEYFVDEVVVAGDDDSFCGNDIAILILAGNVPGSEITPFLPRLDDAPAAPGEIYSAVGYGATDGSGSGAGTRRRRDGLVVDCVAEGCVDGGNFLGQITPEEWAGNGGVCQGDSGGPAIDDQGRVFGVTSRGSLDCEASIYAYTASWSAWLKDTVVYASGMGVYDAPGWTEGSAIDPEHSMPIGDPCDSDADCPSGKCLLDGALQYCTRSCTEQSLCPEDYLCRDDTPFGPACVSTTASQPRPVPSYERADKDGCHLAAPGLPDDDEPWLAGLALLGLAWARRRR